MIAECRSPRCASAGLGSLGKGDPQTIAPNNFPIPAVTPSANAPHNVTRRVARRIFAPPAFAPTAPRNARKPSFYSSPKLFSHPFPIYELLASDPDDQQCADILGGNARTLLKLARIASNPGPCKPSPLSKSNKTLA
jgi:hypothetical protein